MSEIFIDALLDSVKMIPFLLVVYVGIELIEYKFGNKIRNRVQKSGAIGPVVGALAGSLPQCGFSVVATALYTQRLATIGTLMAVYLATSDEAIPVILAQPDKLGLILPLIITKIIIAVVFGYALDFIFRKKNQKTLQHIAAYNHGHDERGHDHQTILDETACCGHNLSSEAKKFDLTEIFFHPIIHTAKIFIFIFIISFLINLAFLQLGSEGLSRLLLGHSFFQPFLLALFGLIPNCAASVGITELYLQGAITYGSVIAGLCASGGLGILILFKEEKDRKQVFYIIGLLFGLSVLAGLIVQYIPQF
jgi:hypothetical protein